MTSLSNQVQKYTSILSNLTKSTSFGNLLGLQLDRILFSVTNEPTTSHRPIVQLNPIKENNASSDIIVRYTIPSRSCIDGSFPLSGFLAVFDEITTLATVVKGLEKKKTFSPVKPGASVTLSVEMGSGGYQLDCLCRPGDKVDIHVNTQKIGQIFSFTSCHASIPETGEILCTGRHCKYLPMRSWPAWLVLGPLFDLASWYCSFNTSGNSTADNTSLVVADMNMDDALNIQDWKTDFTEATFHVKDYHCNPLGVLHGGCTAMLAEQMGNKFMVHNNKSKSGLKLTSMTVTYMSEGRKEISLKTDNIMSNQYGSKLRVVSHRVGGSIIAESILSYENIDLHDRKQTRSKL